MGVTYLGLINSFEFLAVAVLISCIAFLARRNILKLKRFISHDLDGWPRSDANYILITEIILMALFLTLNASDTLLLDRMFSDYSPQQADLIYPPELHPLFIVSSSFHPLLSTLSDHKFEIL